MQVMFPDARETGRQAKTTRCKNELPNPLCTEDHLVQVMFPDAWGAVSLAKAARCKNDLPNAFVQNSTLCR